MIYYLIVYGSIHPIYLFSISNIRYMGCSSNKKREEASSIQKVDTTPLVISGPSGVGKGTIIGMLLSGHPNRFALSISYTTRKKREKETHGVDHYYITEEEFQKMEQEKQFLEIVNYNGNHYGTAKTEIERISKQGKVCIMEITIEGAKQVHAQNIPCNYLFIKAKSEEVLKERLRGRGTEAEEVIQQRIKIGLDEVKACEEAGFYKNQLVNDVKEETYKELEKMLTEIYKVI